MRSKRPSFLLCLLIAVACSSGEGGDAPDTPTSTDVAADVAVDDAASADVTLSDSVSADLASTDGAEGDAAVDTGPSCDEGAWECTEDAYVLRRCESGQWVETACMRAHGQLCEDGACVDPWRYGDPQWGTCADETRGTVETLAEKAAYYDAIAPRLHIHPDLKWFMGCTIEHPEVICPEGVEPPCYEPVVPETEATSEHVSRWWTGENDGLFSAMYLASQAYRYAVTRSDEALATIKLLLEGEVTRMAITGVPGVFTRQFIPPDVPAIKCPLEDERYVVDLEKDDNRWVQVREDGCVWVVDRETLEWTGTDHCGFDAYAGWCWLDNVSQDEYAGHMLALGLLARFVDDPDVQATVTDLLEKVAVHLMENDLTIVDWDGRVTEHGKFYPSSFADAPGYLAIMAMDFVLLGAEVSGREDLRAFYDDCLLQRSGQQKCLDWPMERGRPFTDYLDLMMLYSPGDEGCTSNFNNFSMMATCFDTLLLYETDIELRETLQDAFATHVMAPDHPWAMIRQQNAWFNFLWAGRKKLGPQSDGPAYEAVEEAICALRQFPASQHRRTADSTGYEEYCRGRLGESQTEEPIPVADRCARNFLWWANPYGRHSCTERLWEVNPPADYLLAYWMGRYFGFIPEEL